ERQANIEKSKKMQLNAQSPNVLLQGHLLKRSETLRKWNQRWFTLDPSTGKMEYRLQRGDARVRGLIVFDGDSTITVSPVNIHGDPKYDGCCFYIGTPQKKEFYLCANTPVAARAWVATLRAAALVLKAQEEAFSSLSGIGHAKLGTIAALVAAANTTAQEAANDLQMSLKFPTASPSSPQAAGSMDNVGILKETLRVKDAVLNQLTRDLKARDYIIKELSDRLSKTADAAESVVSAVHAIDKESQIALSEVDHLHSELRRAAQEMCAADERVAGALKAKESALKEANKWCLELGQAREDGLRLEAAVQAANENAGQLKMAYDRDSVIALQSKLGGATS
ncbi:unnamed protein product, partial [Sphagnum balticum]